MYERFTDRARRVLELANRESQRFNHEYIGTEHVLLGLVKEGSGVAIDVLHNFNVDHRDVRMRVEQVLISGPDMVTFGKLPQTARAKNVIEHAMEECRNFGHDCVGTEHILLGLVNDTEGVAGGVLRDLGLTVQGVREAVLKVLGDRYERFGDMKPRMTPMQPGWATALSNRLGKLLARARGQDETESRA